MRGVDQVKIRPDGSVELDVRETIETEHGAVSADVRGYALPDPGSLHLHAIRGFALFSAAAAEYADFNTAVVAIQGSVDMSTGAIDVTGTPLGDALIV